MPLIPMLMCDDIISQEAGGKQGEQDRNPATVLLSLPKKDLLEHPLGIMEQPTSMTQPRPREKLGCLGIGDKEHWA